MFFGEKKQERKLETSNCLRRKLMGNGGDCITKNTSWKSSKKSSIKGLIQRPAVKFNRNKK